LRGGCAETIPSLLMAAASVDLPAVVVPGGPMRNGTFRGVPLGCGTDVWRLSEEVRAGEMSAQEFLESESSMIRSRGHCNTMGTASTMGLLAEALGTTLPGTAGIPAADSRLLARAHETGRLAAVLNQVADLLDPDAITVTGKPFAEYVSGSAIWDPEVIRTRDAPLRPNAGIAVLRGNLAPDGAIVKPAAASDELLVHRGRAV